MGALRTAKDTARNITLPAATCDAQPRAGVVISDPQAPTEAVVNYRLFRLMGWPDVKVWVN